MTADEPCINRRTVGSPLKECEILNPYQTPTESDAIPRGPGPLGGCDREHEPDSELRRRDECSNDDLRFRCLVENCSNPIALAQPDGRFLYVSPSLVQQFGYAGDELMNLGVFGMAHPD